MILLRKIRFSMATVMMLVAASGAASALFAKIHQLAVTPLASIPYLKLDAPILFILAIILTAVGLAALKCHSANQTMLQIMLACLGYLVLIQFAEHKMMRPLLYWFQTSFAVLVTGPLLARRLVKTEMARGPRRDWWKKTLEAVFFSFLTMMLVLLGIVLQWLAFAVGSSLL